MKDYLKKFGDKFQTSVKDLVVSNLEEMMQINTKFRIDAEILHHASYCRKLNSKLNEENCIDKVFFFNNKFTIRLHFLIKVWKIKIFLIWYLSFFHTIIFRNITYTKNT
jgi:hypothetical protein